MKLFSKKNKDLKQLEMTDEISDEELAKEGYKVNEPVKQLFMNLLIRILQKITL